jgi:hypothetical protein
VPRDGRHQRTKIHTAPRPGRIQYQPGDRGTLVSPEQGRWSLPSLDTDRYRLLMNPPVPAGVDGKASDALLKLGRFFTRWEESDDGRVAFRKGGRAGDVFYRDRWSHDKVVRSTHGVNGNGSCSWKIRPRRDHHLGSATDGLSIRRPRSTRVRTPRLPTRCRLFLVHLLPHPSQVPLRARRAAGDV